MNPQHNNPPQYYPQQPGYSPQPSLPSGGAQPKDFEALLRANEAQMNPLVHQLHELRQSYIQTLKTFLKNWFMEIATKFVTTNLETTNAIGTDKLKQMKFEVNALSDTAETLIDKPFSNPEMWWYPYAPNEKPPCGNLGNLGQSHILALEGTMSKILPILARYGYVPRSGAPASKWTTSSDPEFRSITAAWDSYRIVAQQAQTILTERHAIEREMNQMQVRKLWQSL